MDKFLFSSVTPRPGCLKGCSPERLTVKHLSLNPSPITGKYISRLKISSEKNSPLPTPISLNFPRMKSMKFTPKHPIIRKQRNPETKAGNSIAKLFKTEEKKKIKKINKGGEKKKTKKTRNKSKSVKDTENKEKKLVKNKEKNQKKIAICSETGKNKNKKKSAKFKENVGQKKKIRAKKLPSFNTQNQIINSKSSLFLKKIIKIQSFFRGFLVRKRLRILKKNSDSLSYYLSDIDSFYSYFAEDLEQKKTPENQPDFSLNPSSSKKPQDPSQKSKSLLLSEISSKLKQSSKLKKQRVSDLKEIQEAAKRLESDSELVDIVSKIIEKRYDKLETYFTSSINRLQSHLIGLETRKNKTEKSSENGKNQSETDLEKILLNIENIEDPDGSFLQDTQSLSPLTPISAKPEIIKPVEVFETSQENSSENLEFPLRPYCAAEVCSELEPEVSIFGSRKLRKIVWPSQRESCERVSGCSLLKNKDFLDSRTGLVSDLSYTVDQVISLLEIFIYNEILENHLDIFKDEQFVNRLCDILLNKYIQKSLLENARVLNNDSIDVLKTIDEELLDAIKKPAKLISRISDLVNPLEFMDRNRVGFQIDFLAVNFFRDSNNDLGGIKRAVFSSFSQAMILDLEDNRNRCFQYCDWETESFKLTESFISAREKVHDWNELKAGDLPTEEMVNGFGKIDEEKLQDVRTQSLAKVLYFDLFEGNKSWFNYVNEEEQTIFQIENKVFLDIINEIILILSVI